MIGRPVEVHFKEIVVTDDPGLKTASRIGSGGRGNGGEGGKGEDHKSTCLLAFVGGKSFDSGVTTDAYGI